MARHGSAWRGLTSERGEWEFPLRIVARSNWEVPIGNCQAERKRGEVVAPVIIGLEAHEVLVKGVQHRAGKAQLAEGLVNLL